MATKNPQAFKPADSRVFTGVLRANDLRQSTSAAAEYDGHTLICKNGFGSVNELSIMLTLLLQRIVA